MSCSIEDEFAIQIASQTHLVLISYAIVLLHEYVESPYVAKKRMNADIAIYDYQHLIEVHNMTNPAIQAILHTGCVELSDTHASACALVGAYHEATARIAPVFLRKKVDCVAVHTAIMDKDDDALRSNPVVRHMFDAAKHELHERFGPHLASHHNRGMWKKCGAGLLAIIVVWFVWWRLADLQHTQGWGHLE